MSMNDPIADMLTRLRNASQARHPEVNIPYSGFKNALAQVLKKNGFIADASVTGDGIEKRICLQLKYTTDRKPVFLEVDRISKGGRKVYWSHADIKPMRQGSGMAILTTPKGVMSGEEARQAGVGGEVVCTIW
ncbi:MAG: 30S ribosomal protein S8 [Deltaproteobacteria bacterium CG_4_10_14_0_2_um_filter_43_8]|nr:MAG: 30S ribosomal protein S8 [Deltaproteobacteria bacterium CG11_big_fil_rev_8_21_14_0_20_42_23]PJA21595.1 MAG: 30S ribosomal protein S8 [Deltaproteobacteria bacterium CG_4_10_14_0_2_um_filter_43_8]PJC64623.1 MAG: 30S ribosomal protein S8 [Deltaproteobacteria bacterium CG_4_9_14_0_2_um_filter_42_21]